MFTVSISEGNRAALFAKVLKNGYGRVDLLSAKNVRERHCSGRADRQEKSMSPTSSLYTGNLVTW